MCLPAVRFRRTAILVSVLGAAACLVAACSTPLPTGASDGPPTASGLSFDSPGLVRPGPGVTNPRVLRSESPSYTSEAMRAKIQGTVQLEVIVQVDGSVGDVRVLRSLDAEFGLDDAAIEAARAWRFAPALVDGQPVALAVVLELSFTIR